MRKLQPKLWKDSEITMNYVSPQSSFSKEKRFKLYSIYWPEKATSDTNKKVTHLSGTQQTARKISKMIDEEEKNQLRQLKTNKYMVMKQKNNSEIFVRNTMSHNLRNKNKFVANHKVSGIINRLSCNSERKQSKKRDKYGFRSPYEEQPQQFQFSQKDAFGSTMYSSKGFKTAQRIKLDLPENYYPGPGTHRIIRYLQMNSYRQIKKMQKAD